MALKDVAKVVANQKAREDLANTPTGPESVGANTPGITPERRQSIKDTEKLSRTIKPFTSKPANTAGHVGFKFDGSNPFHKDILNTLINNGKDDGITMHEGGVVSFPADAIGGDMYSKFRTATSTSEGGKISFKGEAASVKPRTSTKETKPVTRPSAPTRRNPPSSSRIRRPSSAAQTTDKNPLIEDRAEVMRNLFGK